ncbi:MAG: hypothetical protein JKY95_20275, partial [Planctomycetaceae bacterium]|nr:hypothetical protein [Planctomycetaceae bacterium]
MLIRLLAPGIIEAADHRGDWRFSVLNAVVVAAACCDKVIGMSIRRFVILQVLMAVVAFGSFQVNAAEQIAGEKFTAVYKQWKDLDAQLKSWSKSSAVRNQKDRPRFE